MQVQPIRQQNRINEKQQTFKGITDATLRYFATNQAIGANCVDLCFMVAPRTANDLINRGPAAGLETGRRESMGTINDSSIGLYGSTAGFLIAGALSKKYNTKVNKIFTSPDTLHILAENKSQQLKDKKSQYEYLKTTLENVRAYNPQSVKSDKEGYVKLSDETIEKIAKYFDEGLNKSNYDSWIKKDADKSRIAIRNIIIADTGAETNYILESTNKAIKSKTNLKSLLNDIFIVSESFNNEKVKQAFEEQIKSGKTIKENSYIKGLDKFMKTRAGMGFAIASAVGLSVQPINIYLTKKKTGTDGFVGVEGRTKDTSAGFFGLKTLSSATFFGLVLSTLNMKPWQFTPAKFMDKMAFNGKMPTVNQLKGVYGVTIISRIFSARDTDELREVLTKDTLGYLSWLVLGDIVNRMTAAKLDKSVMNYKKGTQEAGYFKKMYNATLKTRDEVLLETLAKNGISTTKEVDGKVVAKSFKEMLKDLNGLKDDAIKSATRKKLSALNKAQLVGYLFSGLVLGLGIPSLNIYITNKLDKKRKAKAEKENAVKQAN